MILVAFVRELALSRATLQQENIALRQQVAVLNRERPRPRLRLRPLDRVFWVFLSCRAESVADGRQTNPNADSEKHLASFAAKSASPATAKDPLVAWMR